MDAKTAPQGVIIARDFTFGGFGLDRHLLKQRMFHHEMYG